MMRAVLLMFVLLSLALPTFAPAAGPNRSPPQAFSVHDLDRDGYLSREEYALLQARCKERQDGLGQARCALIDFDAMDTDRDGRIGEDELVDALGRRYRGGRKPQD